MATITTLRARDLLPGMTLDLEDDSYATIPCETDCVNCVDIVRTLEFEYAKVEEVEFENINVVRVDCDLISFACPPNHKLKVATD